MSRLHEDCTKISTVCRVENWLDMDLAIIGNSALHIVSQSLARSAQKTSTARVTQPTMCKPAKKFGSVNTN
jgi:hypothetical protein